MPLPTWPGMKSSAGVVLTAAPAPVPLDGEVTEAASSSVVYKSGAPAPSSSKTVTTAEEGLPSDAPPVGEVSARLIVSFPSADPSSRMDTVNVLDAVSLSAQLSEPDAEE